jgi:high-affinity nickel-transport protein
MPVFAALDPSLLSPSFLLAGGAGSVGILAGALALGVRHGMDWDHIAAITDITSTTASVGGETSERHHETAVEVPREAHQFAAIGVGAAGGHAHFSTSLAAGPTHPPREPGRVTAFVETQRRSLVLGTLYALGHGSMVVFLGLLAILFSEILPSWLDPIMERVVGATLVFLGLYLVVSLYRYFRHGDDFRLRSRWMLLFGGVRRAWRRLRSKVLPSHGHVHPHPAEEAQYGAATSYGIGLIHGVGAETGTQVLIIGTAVGAASTGMSIATLFVFVFGLLLSNSVITVVTAAGFVSAARGRAVYVTLGVVAAAFSLSLGLLYLSNSGGLLPDLDPYFRWIGGPDA